ncbi:MAG: DUF4436 family protein [Candidatus Xenobiia bacterium LiM19]
MISRKLQIIIFAVCAIVFIIAYSRLLGGYRLESEQTVQHFSQASKNRNNAVQITAHVVSIDPVKGELLIRLQFEPNDDLLDEDDLLINSITVYTNSAAGRTDATFKKGESMQPIDVTVALQGESSHFPWDDYNGVLWVCLASHRETSGDDEGWIAVPFTLDLKAGVPGFKIYTREIPQKTKGFSVAEINFKVERANSARSFSIFIMLLIGLLTVVAFLAGFMVVAGGRKVELAMFSWLGAQLFAMLPLRNAMPGAPPIGCLADYLSFFWAEAITAATLIAVILTWILRKPSS